MDEQSVYQFYPGEKPVLVSMPHVGTRVPESISMRFTEAAGTLPDTDWYVDRLYDFLPELGVSSIRANYSRYVVDLNRPPTGESLYPGQRVTEICPTTLFNGSPVYLQGQAPDADEVANRVARYWQPYHRKIARELASMMDRFGYAVLWDAHTIKSAVPGLFDGVLPDFNWGTASGKSCDSGLIQALFSATESASEYTVVLNGRFKGGYITRNFGNPGKHIHTVQLELSQATYLADELLFEFDAAKADKLKDTLKMLMETALAWRG